MFTGIVEALGRVETIAAEADGRRITIAADKVLDAMEVGDSVAVNGVCLTAVAIAPGRVTVTAVGETITRSSLGALDPFDTVNLERPMPATGRFDGHIVQGHVDGVAQVAEVMPEGEATRMRFTTQPGVLRYIVEKGSVAVDGVSLTVTAVDETSFELVLIPHTLSITTFGTRQVGDVVNVEVDVLAKYVERLLEETP